ncbi:MAG TPA: peptidylprolyl isomerase [Micromonosporaceae bacterium]
MSSVRDNRQRAAARAKLEREMAARAEAARRKRLMQARIGAAVAAVVVLGAVVWIVTAALSGGDKSPVASPSGPSACVWNTDPNAFNPSAPTSPRAGVKDLGVPPTEVPRSGFRVLTIETNLGTVKIEMDLSKTPCTAANLAFLAEKQFYDGSSCHRLVKEIFALQCGDPSGTGSGGVTYKYADENLPVGKLPAYHEGDVAMANTGQPGTNGTQFFFLFGNSTLDANYTLFGRVIEGMDIIKKVAAGGDDGAFAQQAGGGHPKIKFEFKSVTAGPVTPQSQAGPTPTAAATSVAPSATTAASTSPTP